MMSRVLIVDDEPDLVETCARLLSRLGNDCLTACTAPQAIGLIDRERPDLVVTDLNLPERDGLEVVRHARQTSPPTPVILITAYHSSDTIRAAQDAGATGYLSKPFSTGELAHAVELALTKL